MKQLAAAPWRRLLPLAVAVLAVHVGLLLTDPQIELASRDAIRTASFSTRTIEAAPAAVPDPTPMATATPTPEPVVAPEVPRPAPAPRPARMRRSQAPAGLEPPMALAPAAQEAREESVALVTPVALPASTGDAAAPAPAPARTPAPSPAGGGSPQAVSVLPSGTLHYEATVRTHGFGLHGHGELAWRNDGAAYQARLEISSFGLPARVQRSEGRITAQGLAPDYFADKARSERATHFDRQHGRLVFSNNSPDVPIAAGMQDRLSVVLQLSALVAGAPSHYPPGTLVTAPTAGTGDAEEWVFTVEREETLHLPGGTLETLKLQRLPRKQYDQKVELWLAPRMDYAPVRLRLTNPNGDAADLRWSSTDRG